MEDVGGIFEGRQGRVAIRFKYMQTMNFYSQVCLMVLKHLAREKACCVQKFDTIF